MKRSPPPPPRATAGVILEFPRSRRRVHCPPLLLGAAAGLVGLLALAVIATGAYLLFRDEMLAALLTRQTRLQYAYEDRIAALRLKIDTLAGRQFVDQDGVEGVVQRLALRQAQLETRAAAVDQLVERSGVTAVARARTPAPGATLAAPAPAATARAPVGLRLGDGAKPTPLPPAETKADPRPSAALAPADDPLAPLPQRLDSLAASLERVAEGQRRRLSGVLRPTQAEALRLRRIFDVAGLPVDRYLPRRSRGAGVGGPFIAADEAGGRFETELAVAQSAVATLDGLRRALPAAPVRAPLAGPLQPTSGFGYRTDPFLGRPALHAGLDLRDDYGAAVRATAAGVVTAAGPRGGYGNLVEIDHGAGLSTRYGHLAEIDVAPGMQVAPGAVIGRVGSTGRSTGPHLHYEVRVDGEAVDPSRYLEAATLLDERHR